MSQSDRIICESVSEVSANFIHLILNNHEDGLLKKKKRKKDFHIAHEKLRSCLSSQHPLTCTLQPRNSAGAGQLKALFHQEAVKVNYTPVVYCAVMVLVSGTTCG